MRRLDDFSVRVEIQYNNEPIMSDTPYIVVVTFTVMGATHTSYTDHATITGKMTCEICQYAAPAKNRSGG